MYRACWVSSIPPMPRRFRRTVVVFHRYRPPVPCETGFILSCASFAFRVPSCDHLPARVSAASASLGVSSLFTTSARRVHLPTDIPRPPMFRPQRFARSRRLAPLRTLRACFIALPCPGFSLQGFPPTFRPHHLVGDRYPHVVGAVACRLPGSSERRVDLRVLLRFMVRSVRRVFYARPAPVSPPAFSAPSGFGPLILGAPSRPLRSRSSRCETACPSRR